MMDFLARLLGYFRQSDRGWQLSLLVAVCIVYLPFLGNPFVFDDVRFFSDGTAAQYAGSWFHFDRRWFPYASLGWTYAVFDDIPLLYHLGNMLLHFANTLLLLYFLRHLIRATQPGSGLSTVGAWFGALVFALHPVAVYAVGYVIERSIVMATLFALVMQIAYLRGLLSAKKRWFALAVCAYFLAVFSKEHSILMPLVLGALGLLVRTGVRIKRQVLWLTWSAFLVIAVLITSRSTVVFGAPHEEMAGRLLDQQGVHSGAGMLHLLSVMTQAGLFFKYLLFWVIPNVAWISADMREPFIATYSDGHGWLGLSAFIAYGVAGGWLLLRGGLKGLIGFALLYPWLQFIVELTAVRVQEPFVLYRSYLWMPGLMLFLPILLLRFPQRRTFLALGCVMILLVPLAWNRLWVFGDNYRLWNDAALLLKDEQTAGADRIYFNRGQAEMAAKSWEAAARDFERSAAMSPQLGMLHYALGVAYGNLGRYEEALVQHDTAIKLEPNNSQIYYAKGLVLKRLHRDEEAAQQMEQSCKLKNAVACIIIGMTQQNP